MIEVPEKEEERDRQKTIFDILRLRLINLSAEHQIWLAGGRMYLTNEDGRLVCKDIATNEELTILW